jgi:hypothetical protein
MKPDYIIHPDLAFTRCIMSEGRVTRCTSVVGPCKACGNDCSTTAYPGDRWLVRGFRLEDGKTVRIPGMHLVCHDCLIMWDE